MGLSCCPPPWSPGRGSTGCVQMVPPAHLGHPPKVGMFQRTCRSGSGQGCSSKAGCAREMLYQTRWFTSSAQHRYPANGRVETLEVK